MHAMPRQYRLLSVFAMSLVAIGVPGCAGQMGFDFSCVLQFLCDQRQEESKTSPSSPPRTQATAQASDQRQEESKTSPTSPASNRATPQASQPNAKHAGPSSASTAQPYDIPSFARLPLRREPLLPPKLDRFKVHITPTLPRRKPPRRLPPGRSDGTSPPQVPFHTRIEGCLSRLQEALHAYDVFRNDLGAISDREEFANPKQRGLKAAFDSAGQAREACTGFRDTVLATHKLLARVSLLSAEFDAARDHYEILATEKPSRRFESAAVTADLYSLYVAALGNCAPGELERLRMVELDAAKRLIDKALQGFQMLAVSSGCGAVRELSRRRRALLEDAGFRLHLAPGIG